ncbi:MAG: glycosyltransferase [Flavobacteriales bacterium]|nr:glycosyltransferase [Flavobacteriales bacterium]MCL4282178.1 glycosyltransferase [Flavobacteriales bacterium]HMN04885.1 glycosyltransferase [Flavobacteriales bacterium]
MELPLVSICIPTFQGERFLEEAMRSAFAQTYPALELVISDDGSTDGTLAVVDRLRPEAPMPVRVVKHRPSGIGANWNNCVRHAKGAYIKFLFQDDLLAPNCVARMVAMAGSAPEVMLVYSRRRLLHDPDNPQDAAWVARYGELHRAWRNARVEEGVMPGRTLLRDPALLDLPRNKIGEPPAVLLDRRVFNRHGWFSTELRQALDYVFWYKVLRYGQVGFVDEELVTFRLHAAQATQVNARTGALTELDRLPLHYLRHLGSYLHPSVRRRIFFEFTAMGRLVVGMVHRLRTLAGS